MKHALRYGIVVCAFLVAGCASKSSQSIIGGDTGVVNGNGYGDSSVRTYSESEEALREEARLALKDVFFSFESADLDILATTQLKRNAEWMIAHPSVSVIIEGHCDERGTGEFNMALGERRADIAKSFLVKAGVASSRIQTVSYGEERPFEAGHDDSAWAKNRRAHFVVE